MVKKLLAVRSYDLATNLGLLVLRLGAFVPLFLKHGLEKVSPASFNEMAPNFPDPAHIGHVPSLLVATGSDAICSILLILGLCTRFAGAYVFVILSVAWAFTHHFMFFGKGLEPKHGELIVLYIVQGLALALLGPGKFSLDGLLWKNKLNRAASAVALLCAITFSLFAKGAMAQGLATATPPSQAKPGLTLATTAFDDGGIIPNKYTQASAGTPPSPQLQWTHVPDGTVSFALIVNDPDTAPDKSTEVVLHWLIFNIPGTATGLPEGVPNDAQLPDGSVQALNRAKKIGYMGMGASAAGPYHHYSFELYALDTKLTLGPDATRAEVLAAMKGHILGKGVLVGRFHRP